MCRLVVRAFSLSIEGYGAGVQQSSSQPLGLGGHALHEWMFATRTFQAMTGGEGGSSDADDRFAQRSMHNVGAWILGRNMFGPVRGPWPDDSWKGWWGDNPPYHVPTFVLTRHRREPLVMDGGTTFHFVTGGIHEALDRARDAARGLDVRIGGGVQTVRQYLKAGLVDELHLVHTPAVLGAGEALLAGIDLTWAGFHCVERVGTPNALHVVLSRTPGSP